jgi:hypothetical protein
MAAPPRRRARRAVVVHPAAATAATPPAQTTIANMLPRLFLLRLHMMPAPATTLVNRE